MTKEIKRNKANRDYDMFLDGRYIGSRDTYTEAQTALDQAAYDALT